MQLDSHMVSHGVCSCCERGTSPLSRSSASWCGPAPSSACHCLDHLSPFFGALCYCKTASQGPACCCNSAVYPHMLFSSRSYVHEYVRRCTVVSYLPLLSASVFLDNVLVLWGLMQHCLSCQSTLFNLRALLPIQVKATVMAWVRGAGAGPGQQPPFLRNKIAQVLVCIVQVRRHLAPQTCSALLMGFKVVWQRMPSVTWLANMQHVLLFNKATTVYIIYLTALRYAKGRAKKLLCRRNACVYSCAFPACPILH